MKIIRNILAAVILPVNIITAVLALLAAYGEYISPQLTPYPALLGLAFPIVVAVNALFIFVWIFVKPLFLLLPLLTTLAAAPAIWKYTPIHFGDYIDDNRPGFTLLSYNVYYFSDIEQENNPDAELPEYNRTLQNILDADADIVMAQEAPLPQNVKWRKVTDGQLRQLHRRYPYYVNGKNSFVLSKYPIEKLLYALNYLHEAGIPCLAYQDRYNMFDRHVEEQHLQICSAKGIGVVAFSPLAQGILSDKYLHGIPADSRAARPEGYLKTTDVTPEKIERVTRLKAIADERGQTISQLALSWVLRRDEVSSVIVGARNLDQLKGSLHATENLVLTPTEIKLIDDILA